MNFNFEKTFRANQLQRECHSGQLDKAGKPYAEHPERVAQIVQSHPHFLALETQTQQDVVCAAYLHDVIEDTEITEEELISRGMSNNTVDAVKLLSKNIAHSYATSPDGGLDIVAYYAAIRDNPIARMVKLADMADNSNHARQALLSEQGYEFNSEKYAELLQFLHPDREEILWWEQMRNNLPIS